MKTTYLNSSNKRIVRDFLLQKFQFEAIVGLAGPDINEYLEYLKNKGAKSFEIYENNPQMLVKQLTTLNIPDIKLSLKYRNILSAIPNKENVLYDLDFCTTIITLYPHVKRFKEHFIMTFCLRPIGTQETLDTFFSLREEHIINRESHRYFLYQVEKPICYTEFTTDKGKYIFTSYRDSTPMGCIAKIA